MVTINFSDVKKSKELVPPGKYLAKVTSVNEDRRTKEGDKMWWVTHTIMGGEYDGRIVEDRMTFRGRALERMMLLLECLGDKPMGETTVTPQMIMNQPVWITVIIEEYKGKDQNNISFEGFEPYDGDSPGDNEKPPEGDLPF